MTIRIRAVDCQKADVEELVRGMQTETFPLDDIADPLEGFWWVAYEGTVPAAFAGLYWSQQIGKAGYLCRAGVLPTFRGMGLQSRLLAARTRKAKALGMTSLVTTTFDNPHSINNLIDSGFRAFEHPNPYGVEGTCYWRKPL